MTLEFLNDFIKQFSNSLPPALQDFKSEFENQFRNGLILALERLDLVTRQEFDIQANVLSRTRDKLEKLEQELQALESSNVHPPVENS
jgi:hypothetical protein